MREKIANPAARPSPGSKVGSVSTGLAGALWALISAYGSMYLVPSVAGNLLLVAASMINPIAGLAGLMCGAWALAIRWALGLSPRDGNIDILNAALVGVYLGSVFAPTSALASLVALAAALTVLISAISDHSSTDHRSKGIALPTLSFPFILVSWCALAAGTRAGIPTAVPMPPLLDLAMSASIDHALRCFGALISTPHAAAGALVAVALVITSPFLLVISLAGYLIAQLVLQALGGEAVAHLTISAGANGILTALVLGGLLMVPSRANLLVPVLAVLVSTLLVVGLTPLLVFAWLPPLSLPFALTVYVVLLALRPTNMSGVSRLWLDHPAHPERSLEIQALRAARGLADGSVGLRAPYRGTWDVYQGNDGPHTHRGPWRFAVDFHQVKDSRAYRDNGSRLGDFYCYDAAVVSPVWGTVVAVRNDVPDNAPGDVNVVDNWGNYVLIAIGANCFVMLAHLKAGSVVLTLGTSVSPETVIGRCGNSGRSPQPHLHMHVQIGMELGAATTPFHLSNVLLEDAAAKTFALDLQPRVGNVVTAATPSSGLQHALQLAPGRHIAFRVQHAGSPASTVEEMRSLDIKIGLLGDLFIESDRGARVSMVPTDQMLAFHDRSGPADPLLDAFVLACGLTPLDDSATTWSDAPAARLLPKTGFWGYARLVLQPLSPALATVYRRNWNAAERAFVQSGHHVHSIAGITLDIVDTEVMVDEALGISRLRLSNGGRMLIEAHVVAVGLQPDLGIPGWRCEEPVPISYGKAA